MEDHITNTNIKTINLTSLPILPKRATPFSALDLYSTNNYIVQPYHVQLIPTGIKIQLPTDIFAIINGRSSLSQKGILIHPGIIDNDYRGELKVILQNLTKTNLKIKTLDKIAQLIIHNYHKPQIIEVTSLEPSIRQEQGFGSSSTNTMTENSMDTTNIL